MSNESLKTCILERIDREGVCPRPRVWFQTRECVVWTLWLISVVIGALAVAVTLYAFVIRRYALFEVTHGSFWWSLATALPYIWLFTFVGMAAFAVYNVRHTKRGYRYPLWQILLSSMVVSILAGFGLHVAGLGFVTDTMLGERLALYQSQQKYERQLWQQPAEGRLVAAWEGRTDDEQLIVMRDIDGVTWTVDVAEVDHDDYAMLQSGQLVKVLGFMGDSSEPYFTACGSTPWYFNKSVSQTDLLADRESFLRRMRRHRRQLDQETNLLSATATAPGDTADQERHCAQLVFLDKIPAY